MKAQDRAWEVVGGWVSDSLTVRPAFAVWPYVEVALIDLVDDLQVPGQQGLQQLNWPALQSLRQHSVVGVGKGSFGQVPGL